MKKGFIIFFILLFLTGCRRTFAFELPDEEITLYKNVIQDEGCYTETFKPIIIREEHEKQEIIDHLNSWIYVNGNDLQLKPSCGYPYSIQWNDHIINIISVGDHGSLISYNGNVYRIIGGNFQFFEEYDYQLDIQ